ncbi:unnamed protein product [Pylaiella littoralis]
MRLESEATGTLMPPGPRELRVNFSCFKCETINLAVSLQAKCSDPNSKMWSMDDTVVHLHFHALRSWIWPPAVPPRKRNNMASSPRDAMADERAAVELAGGARSTLPEVEPKEVDGEGRVSGITPSDSVGVEKRHQAALQRAAQGKVKMKNPANIHPQRIVSASPTPRAVRVGENVVVPTSREKKRSPQRTYACVETDVVNLAASIHRVGTGCSGPLTTEGARSESSSSVGMEISCCGCGAKFDRLELGGTDDWATVLGILLAGSTFTAWSASCQYSDHKVMDGKFFSGHKRKILAAVDRLMEEHLEEIQSALRADKSRLVKVHRDDHYFLKHRDRLLEFMTTPFGLQLEGTGAQQRGENLEDDMMAVNLLRVLKQKSLNKGGSGDVNDWFPKFEMEGERVLLTEIDVALDASFRHRSRVAQGASVIQSVELKEDNEKGRRTVVHDLVSISQRCSEGVHLGLHCAFARDGERCFLHGTEDEWKAEVAKGGEAKKKALRLNCLSSGAIRYPLAAQTAEGAGAKLICLRTLLAGFWVRVICHDQDAHIGSIFRVLYNPQECFD